MNFMMKKKKNNIYIYVFTIRLSVKIIDYNHENFLIKFNEIPIKELFFIFLINESIF